MTQEKGKVRGKIQSLGRQELINLLNVAINPEIGRTYI